MTSPREIEIKDNREDIPFKYSITSYGADYDLAGLVRRIRQGDVYVPAFQRGFVWTIEDASRFIESLLLGLPVPGVFFAREVETNKLLVIDGQQRLFSLVYYYDGRFLGQDKDREFSLKGISSEYDGKTYRTLREEDRRRLDDSIIHATIVRQDDTDLSMNGIFLMFERLNTGGVQLQPQEIRSALYHGDFSELIAYLNKNGGWRSLYGPISQRLRDEELILRFFALYYDSEHYRRPMAAFLNYFMSEHRYMSHVSREKFSKVFLDTAQTINTCIGSKAFKPAKALNAALLDALMVAVARRIEHGPIINCVELVKAHQDLLASREFMSSIETSTTNEGNILKRISIATKYIEIIK